MSTKISDRGRIEILEIKNETLENRLADLKRLVKAVMKMNALKGPWSHTLEKEG